MELDETWSCLCVFTPEGCCEAKQIEDRSVGGVWRRHLRNVTGIEMGAWCSALVPAAGSSWYWLFGKKKKGKVLTGFGQSILNGTKKDVLEGLAEDWIANNSIWKCLELKLILRDISYIGTVCFLAQWKCYRPFLNTTGYSTACSCCAAKERNGHSWKAAWSKTPTCWNMQNCLES